MNYKLFCIHCLTSSDSYHVVDIVNRATTREVVDRTSDTLEDRTDSYGIAEALYELITDVTNLEVREYQYVSMTSDSAARSLLLAY